MSFLLVAPLLIAARAAFPSIPPERPLPFRSGEVLHYKIGWASFANAASGELEVLPRSEPDAANTVHFRSALHSLPPLRALFPVDDEFDSFADARTFESRQYEFHLDEMGEKETRTRHFSAVGVTRSVKAPRIVVPAGTLDPLGTLYSMRAHDWKQMPDFRASMYDGHDVFQVRAHIEIASETVAVDSGNVAASRVDIRLLQAGIEVPQTAISIWFANAGAHTPVLLEASMPYGKIHAELCSGR